MSVQVPDPPAAFTFLPDIPTWRRHSEHQAKLEVRTNLSRRWLGKTGPWRLHGVANDIVCEIESTDWMRRATSVGKAEK